MSYHQVSGESAHRNLGPDGLCREFSSFFFSFLCRELSPFFFSFLYFIGANLSIHTLTSPGNKPFF